ncbi:hypothetical protein KY343_02020 [Candidatus Woesearchaeota archaeon]|nr:hypothetical protein [Candidatus Woesearchaeota archaeon]
MSLDTQTIKAEKENKMPSFVGMKKIRDRDARIRKPEGANLVCRCGGYAKFWQGEKPQNNGMTWHEIPAEFNWVYFPELSPASEDYGTPRYER